MTCADCHYFQECGCGLPLVGDPHGFCDIADEYVESYDKACQDFTLNEDV